MRRSALQPYGGISRRPYAFSRSTRLRAAEVSCSANPDTAVYHTVSKKIFELSGHSLLLSTHSTSARAARAPPGGGRLIGFNNVTFLSPIGGVQALPRADR